MRWMVNLYDKTLVWSQHRHAQRYLAAVSFAEASVFPIPPFFMLIPMALARPKKALDFALIATIFSVLGGVIGYLMGYFIFKPIMLPLIEYFGYNDAYQNIINMFQTHGFLALLILGMTPVLYKLIAIGAGFLMIPLPIFILVSLISRSIKFYAVAILIRMGGPKMEQHLRAMIEKLGFVLLGLFGIVIYVYLR